MEGCKWTDRSFLRTNREPVFHLWFVLVFMAGMFQGFWHPLWEQCSWSEYLLVPFSGDWRLQSWAEQWTVSTSLKSNYLPKYSVKLYAKLLSFLVLVRGPYSESSVILQAHFQCLLHCCCCLISICLDITFLKEDAMLWKLKSKLQHTE